MDQWMGNLFYEKVSTVEIKNMSYREMKYWNSWHEVMQEQYKKESNKRTGGNK